MHNTLPADVRSIISQLIHDLERLSANAGCLDVIDCGEPDTSETRAVVARKFLAELGSVIIRAAADFVAASSGTDTAPDVEFGLRRVFEDAQAAITPMQSGMRADREWWLRDGREVA